MQNSQNRREFLKTSTGTIFAGTLAGGMGGWAASSVQGADQRGEQPTFELAGQGIAKPVLPRYRGFNLLHFFQALDLGERGNGNVSEDDCRMIRDLGFNFVRIPMDYWVWIKSDWRKTGKLSKEDMFNIDEKALEKVDRTIETANRLGLHVNLNFHRAPGYCVNQADREPCSLWSDETALDAFCLHWKTFAQRYKGIGNEQLSFNLVNEAPDVRRGYMSRDDYVRVMSAGHNAIRAVSPDRLIFVDGLNYGNVIVEELIPTGMVQSVHGYTPSEISHYRASWVDTLESFRTPTWPIVSKTGKVIWDRQRLEQHYAPWGRLVQEGTGVHCGEIGCYNRTPYNVMFDWMSDTLEILASHNIGYALWEFRGTFGILDSGRQDAQYVDYHGHQLDKKYADLLVRF
ncbi:MAG: glycoside hydrolase family 5 protein [Thermoguttaceae bacterium]